MTREELELAVAMSDEFGNTTDADIARFALLRDRQVKDLVLMVRRALRYAPADFRVRSEDYLRRNELQGTPLRAMDDGNG